MQNVIAYPNSAVSGDEFGLYGSHGGPAQHEGRLRNRIGDSSSVIRYTVNQNRGLYRIGGIHQGLAEQEADRCNEEYVREPG